MDMPTSRKEEVCYSTISFPNSKEIAAHGDVLEVVEGTRVRFPPGPPNYVADGVEPYRVASRNEDLRLKNLNRGTLIHRSETNTGRSGC